MTKKNKLIKKKGNDWVNLKNIRPISKTEIRRITYIMNGTVSAGTFDLVSLSPATFIANATEWASYIARYQEYRFLAIAVHVSATTAATSIPSSGGIICATDRSGTASNPGSGAALWALDAAKVFESNYTNKEMIRYEVKAIDLEDQNYTPVANTSTPFQLFVGLDLSAASTTSFRYYCEALVEFKGTK